MMQLLRASCSFGHLVTLIVYYSTPAAIEKKYTNKCSDYFQENIPKELTNEAK